MKTDNINTKEELLEAIAEADRLLDSGRETLKEYRGKTNEEIGPVMFILLTKLKESNVKMELRRNQLCMLLGTKYNMFII